LFEQVFQQKYILASQSPRRRQILSLIGLPFSVVPSNHDEDTLAEPDPINHVLQQSAAKAAEVAAKTDDGMVIGADTIVVLDGEILGKPETPDHAVEMLKRLSGRTHHVFTGFTIWRRPDDKRVSDYEVTAVHFRHLDDWEIARYVQTKSPMDKAGAYGIQDQSAVFADRIEGCFYNVVGFPLTRFYVTLLQFLQEVR
jgi:septum formation protein